MADPTPSEVERYIAQGLACEHVEVDGDGRHFFATIVSADLPRFVQQRPGSAMRFTAVTLAEAIAAAREQAAMLEAVRAGLKPVGLGLDTEHLLSVNLVDGWVDAHAPLVDPALDTVA